MCRSNVLRIKRRLLIASLLAVLAIAGWANAQEYKDPHRPICTSASCQKIRSFVKAHYCGAAVGSGPDDSCEIRPPKSPGADVKVIAAFECNWVEDARKCEQH